MSHDAESSKSELKLDLRSVDEELNKVLEAKFKKELEVLKKDVKNHSSYLPIYLGSFLLFILLCLNSFIGYQQWQQSQKINELIQQSTSTNQIVPSTQ